MAKVERRHREAAVELTKKHGAPRHLVEEWVGRDAPLPAWMDTSDYFGPLVATASALAEAEQRGFAAGKMAERKLVVEWLDGVGTQYMDGDMVPCDEFKGEAYHQAADEIDEGEHVTSEHGAGVDALKKAGG